MAEELDVISLWKKSKESATIPDVDLSNFDKKPTRTVLYWIKFILTIEFWLSIVGLPFFIYYLIYIEPKPSLLAFYVIFTLVYLVYYRFLIRSINQFSYDGNVVASLRKVYGYLRFYLLHYKVVIWVSLVVGIIIGLIDASKEHPMPEGATPFAYWGLIVLFSTIAVGIIGGIFHFLIHLIYGRKIRRLRGIVKSLEKSE